jgi:single-strand DNA-binding protein
MSTKIPVSLEGNLTADPEYGVSESGVKYARFQIAVNERVKDAESGQWADGDAVFHRVSAFGKVAENVQASLKKGDTALVMGDLEQRKWADKTTGEPRTGSEVVADAVGVSLKYRSATVNRAPAADAGPKADGPDVTATGPVTTPKATTKSAVSR